jgi:hypothetical protein
MGVTMEIERLTWKVATLEGIQVNPSEIPSDAITVYSLIKGEEFASGYRTIETIWTPGMDLEELYAEVEEVLERWEEKGYGKKE